MNLKYCRSNHPVTRQQQRPGHGFTLIELMIVIAVIAIILTLALPVYTNYTIRTKVGEALSMAAAAKTAVASTCPENPTLSGLTNDRTGYAFSASTWVQSIMVSEDCQAPVITIATRDTGATVDPQLTLTGSITTDGTITWICASDAPNYQLPAACRRQAASP